MDVAFWAERWREGRIGFHEGRPNALLSRHVGHLGPAPRRVLVPLCGKTEDLAFLAAQGHRVVGIEAVEDAVRAFFDEHGLRPIVSERSAHVREYRAGDLTLLAGDVFACSREHVGEVDALYDRAALVALPEDVRPAYVAHLRSLLAPRSRGLLITFDFDQSKLAPPPHAVGEAEVRRLYEGAHVVRVDATPLTGERFREAGAPGEELCFTLELPAS